MFNGIWLVATEPLTVGGRDIKAGESFHLSRVHSGALLVTGRATIAHPQPPPKSRTPEPEPVVSTPRRRRRAPKAEPVDVPVESPAAPPETPAPFCETSDPYDQDHIEIPDRRYHRRDLEAEE